MTIFLESTLVLIDIADSILDAKMVWGAGSEAGHSWNCLVKVWWDIQFVVPISQLRPIWSPKQQLEKIPNNVVCLWETTIVPQSSLFPLSLPQNRVTWRLKKQCLALPWARPVLVEVSLSSCAGLGRGLCLTDVLSALLMTLPNHSGSVWVWVGVCETGDPGVVLPGSTNR